MKRTTAIKVRKIWENTNSQKDQVSVMFAQQYENNTGSVLIAAAQGTGNFGPSMLTTIMSFNREKAIEYFGTTEADYSTEPFENWGDPSKFEAAVGKKVVISVEENLTPNPQQKNHQPKTNPTTGEILLSDGSPIYRHTELAVEGTEKTIMLKHNATAAADAFATTETAKADVFAVAGATASTEDGN